jgi:bifunctional non-homologous end joining protein LigD
LLRFPVEPMNATLGSLPSEADDDGWAYEIKWDGYRTLAFVEDGALRLQSRRLLDVTVKYPEIAGLPQAVNAARAVLDGEIVCFDETGRPSFEALQRHETQAVFHVFDVLSVDGTDTIALPYEQRRALLVDVVEPDANWLVPAHRIGDGAALLAATAQRGLEGVMAKRLGSTYTPGKRTKEWRKIKNRIRAEVVIGGYTAGSGNREGTFGALLVGRPGDDGRLAFAGGVGTGFNQATLDMLRAELRSRRTQTCPFDPPPPRMYVRDATWVRPELRAEIELTEFTNVGLVRQSSFLHLVEGG